MKLRKRSPPTPTSPEQESSVEFEVSNLRGCSALINTGLLSVIQIMTVLDCIFSIK